MLYGVISMANLREILKKDINRTIEGVIKADDQSQVLQEVDEYVLTDEVAKQLEKVVEDYLESIGSAKKGIETYPVNGVWISGYFGSGKSHLLKILAYLMENNTINGTRLKDLFLPKIKDQFLKGNFMKVLDVPSKSVLFNIDQLADAAKTQDENIILFIFEKAFNRLQGYFHENRAIAEIERHLDEEDSYEQFKEYYLKSLES